MGYKFLSWIGLVPALPWVTCQQASFPLDQLSVYGGEGSSLEEEAFL